MSTATRVAIVGLGAIGGSAALKLMERGAAPLGFAASDEDRRLAADAGIRVATSLEEAVREADLVLIAVPLDHLATVAKSVVASASATATILHAASLQRPDATRLDPAVASRVVGTHPLAGSASSGFSAARVDMFQGATVYMERRDDQPVRDDADLFWSMAGASRVEHLPADKHDNLMAAVSHVPQLLATALAASFSYGDVDRSSLGPGGRDMTRLAASSWEMWRPLLAATPGRTLALLETMESELAGLRASIQAGDLKEAEMTWSIARTWGLGERTS